MLTASFTVIFEKLWGSRELQEMKGKENVFFRGNETELNKIIINQKEINPEVTVKETTDTSRTYKMHVKKDSK